MASPFSRFRKNQKKWLAFLGVVCMFSFVLWSPGMHFACGTPPIDDQTVHTRVRNVTTGELQDLVQQHDLMDRFASVMDYRRREAATQAEHKRSMTRQEIEQFERQFGGFRPSLSRRVNSQHPFREALDTWLKVQKADELGITVSDEAINQYIRDRSGETVRQPELDAFLRNHGMSASDFYKAMRIELLAQRVDELYGFGASRASELTPAERKEVFDRQHRRAHTQVVPIKVADFAALVPEPSDETLKEFFERGRDRPPDPTKPDPAFKLPALAQFQYLRVSERRFRDAALAALTSEEVRAHYDKLVKDKNSFPGFDLRFDEQEWRKDEKEWRDSLTSPKKDGDKKKDAKDADKKPGGSATPDKAAPPKAKSGGSSGGTSDGSGAAAAAAPVGDASPEARRLTYPVAAVAEALAQDDPPAKTPGTPGADAKEPPKPAGSPETKTDEAAKEPSKSDAPAKTDDPSVPAVKLPGVKPESLSPLWSGSDRTLNLILNDLTIPEDIRDLPSNRNPEFKPFWQVEDKVREDLAKTIAKKDALRLLALIQPKLQDYYNLAQKKKKDLSALPPSPLADPAQARQIIEEAFAKLAEEKNLRMSVDADIKRLTEEKKVTPEEFKKLANESKNAEWLKLLEDQQKLADSRPADRATWQASLAKKRTNLDPPGSAAPEKDQANSDSTQPKESPKTAPEQKEANATDAKDANAKPADAKRADAKRADAKPADAKPADAKPADKAPDSKRADPKATDAKTASGQKSSDAKEKAKDGATDSTTEPTDFVVSLDKTDDKPQSGDTPWWMTGEGLDQREFGRRSYPLARSQLPEGDEQRDFISWFERAAPFQPLISSATDDHFLFWKIGYRPMTTLLWARAQQIKSWVSGRPSTSVWDQSRIQGIVLETYRKHEARALALEHAERLADEVRRELKDFPTDEVLRLFHTGPQDETSRVDRANLTLSSDNTPVHPELYAVVAELFENGKRSPLPAPASREPLEAPPASLEEAQQTAIRLAADLRDPRVLVVVGKSIGWAVNKSAKKGNALPETVFQGIEGFRWRQSAQDAARGDEAQGVFSGPGRLARRVLEVPRPGTNRGDLRFQPGYEAPWAAPSVSMTTEGNSQAGEYHCYYRFKYADGTHSAFLSPLTTITATANQGFSWTIPASTDSHVAGIELLRTLANDSATIYLVTTLALGTTSYDDKLSDAHLSKAEVALRVGRQLVPVTWDQLQPLGRPLSDDESTVAGLVMPGEALAETVFGLQPGGVAAAINQPQTIVYLVQVTRYDYYVHESVYPAVGSLDQGPLGRLFLEDCRQTIEAEERYPSALERHQQQLSQMPEQFRHVFPPPRMPVSLAYEDRLSVQRYLSWRDALYAEFDVKNDKILDRSER